jgi:hypothetical protein
MSLGKKYEKRRGGGKERGKCERERKRKEKERLTLKG